MRARAILFSALIIQLLPANGVQLENPKVAVLYQRGLSGDREAVVQCIAALEAILKSEPDNQLARVYLGSACTLRSRDLSFGPEKLRALKKGIALMDTAVSAAPDNARVRLVRALTCDSLPFFVGRRKAARAEFYALAKIVERDPRQLNPNDQQLLYLNAGRAAKASGEKEKAINFWRVGLTKAADPKLTAELNAALASL